MNKTFNFPRKSSTMPPFHPKNETADIARAIRKQADFKKLLQKFNMTRKEEREDSFNRQSKNPTTITVNSTDIEYKQASQNQTKMSTLDPSQAISVSSESLVENESRLEM